jgi:hypothetical protein
MQFSSSGQFQHITSWIGKSHSMIEYIPQNEDRLNRGSSTYGLVGSWIHRVVHQAVLNDSKKHTVKPWNQPVPVYSHHTATMPKQRGCHEPIAYHYRAEQAVW